MIRVQTVPVSIWKPILKPILIALAIPLAAALSPINIEARAQESSQEITGTLTINLQGFMPGSVNIALFQPAKLRQAFRRQSVTMSDGKATAIFTQIPMGDYAVKVLREGKNERLKLTAVTYSKNEDRILGPSWKKGYFHMNKAEMTVEVAAK